MLKIYYRGSCSSSQRAMKWLKKYNIDMDKKIIGKISREDIVRVLALTDQGMRSIVKRIGKSGDDIQSLLYQLEDMSFNEAIDFLLTHPELLQTPIILDKDNYLVGYNEDEIRKFLPKKYRGINRRNIL